MDCKARGRYGNLFNLRFSKEIKRKKNFFTILLTVTLVQQHKYCAEKIQNIKHFFPQSLSVNIEKCKSSLISS